MQRRQVLAALPGTLAASAGCLSSLDGGSSGEGTLATVDDPPGWLGSDVDCGDGSVMGSLTLREPMDSVPDSVGVVEYAALAPDARLIVRFEIEHGGAQTCTSTGASAFQRLLGDIDDHARERYVTEHGEYPESIAIHAAGDYYELHRLLAYDQVLD